MNLEENFQKVQKKKGKEWQKKERIKVYHLRKNARKVQQGLEEVTEVLILIMS